MCVNLIVPAVVGAGKAIAAAGAATATAAGALAGSSLFVPAAMLASAGVSAWSQLQAGQAAARSGEFQSRQYDIQRRAAAVETSAALRMRQRQFEQQDALNKLAISFSGFTPASFDGLMEGNRITVREDLGGIAVSGGMRTSELAVQASAAFAEGQQAARASRIGAASTVFGAAVDYEINRGVDMPSLFRPWSN